MTDDEMAQREVKHHPRTATRCEHLLEWARSPSSRSATVHPGSSRTMGPAPIRKDCDAIACTPKRKASSSHCIHLAENELPPLEILLVLYLVDDEGEVLKVRGSVPVGPTGMNHYVRFGARQAHRFVSALDATGIQRVHGMLHGGPESHPPVVMGRLNDHHRGGSLIVVGDVSVATCSALMSCRMSPSTWMKTNGSPSPVTCVRRTRGIL